MQPESSQHAGQDRIRGEKLMATVSDVARLANVSIATVSRVLTGSATVAAETRERVLQAVSDLQYAPNRAAQNLRIGRSSTVALAVGDIEQTAYAAFTRHLQPVLESVGLDLLLYNLAHSGDRLARLLRDAEGFGVSAVVIATSDAMDEDELVRQAQRLTAQNIRLIVVNQDMSHLGIPSVIHDDTAASDSAVSFLIETGRTPIAYLGRVAGSRVGQARRQGYVDALTRAGIAVDPDLIWDSYYRFAAGYEAVDRAFGRGQQFRAIQCGSDELATGALAALKDHGISVPEQVAVVGFGDTSWSAHLRPALTTLSSDPQQVAFVVRTLLTASEGGPMQTLIRRHFVRRDSA